MISQSDKLSLVSGLKGGVEANQPQDHVPLAPPEPRLERLSTAMAMRMSDAIPSAELA